MPTTWKRWTSEEIELLRNGILPEGRTMKAAWSMARNRGFQFSIGDGWFYTEAEKELIRQRIVPFGRTIENAKQALTRFRLNPDRNNHVYWRFQSYKNFQESQKDKK